MYKQVNPEQLVIENPESLNIPFSDNSQNVDIIMVNEDDDTESNVSAPEHVGIVEENLEENVAPDEYALVRYQPANVEIIDLEEDAQPEGANPLADVPAGQRLEENIPPAENLLVPYQPVNVEIIDVEDNPQPEGANPLAVVPGGRQRQPPYRHTYSRADDLQIIRYIDRYGLHKYVGGTKIWDKFAEIRVCLYIIKFNIYVIIFQL
jgi:hypothetical protein